MSSGSFDGFEEGASLFETLTAVGGNHDEAAPQERSQREQELEAKCEALEEELILTQRKHEEAMVSATRTIPRRGLVLIVIIQRRQQVVSCQLAIMIGAFQQTSDLQLAIRCTLQLFCSLTDVLDGDVAPPTIAECIQRASHACRQMGAWNTDNSEVTAVQEFWRLSELVEANRDPPSALEVSASETWGVRLFHEAATRMQAVSDHLETLTTGDEIQFRAYFRDMLDRAIQRAQTTVPPSAEAQVDVPRDQHRMRALINPRGRCQCEGCGMRGFLDVGRMRLVDDVSVVGIRVHWAKNELTFFLLCPVCRQHVPRYGLASARRLSMQLGLSTVERLLEEPALKPVADYVLGNDHGSLRAKLAEAQIRTTSSAAEIDQAAARLYDGVQQRAKGRKRPAIVSERLSDEKIAAMLTATKGRCRVTGVHAGTLAMMTIDRACPYGEGATYSVSGSRCIIKTLNYFLNPMWSHDLTQLGSAFVAWLLLMARQIRRNALNKAWLDHPLPTGAESEEGRLQDEHEAIIDQPLPDDDDGGNVLDRAHDHVNLHRDLRRICALARDTRT